MKLYEALLHLYPASFRAEYGGEMCAIFGRRRRDASGFAGALAVWVAAFFEVLGNAAMVHADVLRQDLRYTARTLAAAPGFALTAILVVALGVGANTAAFSLADYVLIRALPFPDSSRLVKLWESHQGYPEMELSPANYRDWKRLSTVFESVGCFSDTAANLSGQGDPQRLSGADLSAELLPVLGAQPLMGRRFTAADDQEGAAGTLLLSYGLWQRVFGGDSGVLGRRVLMDSAPYVVIGVMPPDFHFPNREAEFWRAIRLPAAVFQDRNDNWLEVVGRIRAGVSLTQARAEMSLVAAQIDRQFPQGKVHPGATVNLLRDELSKQSRLLLMALAGASICVLLIACTNLANLLLARALVRQKELAVRTAMGAGRERLVRQMMTESLTLAVLGGALGVVVAIVALPLLASLVPASLPIAGAPPLDIRIFGFAGLLTLATGVGFGVVPAWRVCSGANLSGLREGVRSGGGRKERLRSAFVVAEVMASVVLLVSAGLLMRALWRLQTTDPGFRAEGVLTLRTALPFPKYDKTAQRQEFYRRVLDDVRQIPGVTSAAYISFLPMTMGGGIWPVAINGQPADRAANNTASMRFITPGFFTAMGIPQRMGRDVSDSDTLERTAVAVVSESFVRRYWPRGDALDRHFLFGLRDRTVVGVVGDVLVRGLDRISEPQVYLPSQQVADGDLQFYAPKDLVIRSALQPAALLPAARRAVHNADPEQPVSNARTLPEIVEENTAPRAVEARVLGAFAAIAFLLAAIGIHGVLAFMVSQRWQEIGVRVALGARPAGIVAMVLKQGLFLAFAGLVPGLVLAYAAGRAMEALLAGVKPADTPTFLCAAGLAVAMTVAGSLLPALRAVRVDPITAIRS
jgi:predicted permease